ncbi:MAG: helix-turn-helix transcriptional regulator [Natronohydrobacter sp.]|nr:helix-turn-helix transcriptional regulator [Natronohydrobacter sp.]
MEQDKNSSAQLRAARALIGWSQQALADAARVSSMTVKRAEGSGNPAASADAITSLRAALESAGVVFLPENGGGPGVRLKKQAQGE